ncbi:hypothetical protein AAVH_32595 [Aphelenchoides avenae]|nr:hypothetical protein AAVH_32595 [Aphelenchus avenae]
MSNIRARSKSYLQAASSVSTRTQSLKIVVSPSPVEDEDLRDFSQHLSYCYRGKWNQLRIYDFPGEQHGAAAAIHLQIVLHPDKRLEIFRALRHDLLFFESDE